GRADVRLPEDELLQSDAGKDRFARRRVGRRRPVGGDLGRAMNAERLSARRGIRIGALAVDAKLVEQPRRPVEGGAEPSVAVGLHGNGADDRARLVEELSVAAVEGRIATEEYDL